MEPRTITTLLMATSYHLLFYAKSINIFSVVAVSSGTFLTTAGCDISPRDGVNLIISLLKLVYINLFVTV